VYVRCRLIKTVGVKIEYSETEMFVHCGANGVMDSMYET
jgi:hypothetical protein